jgi:hypothetical protein
MQEKGLGSLKFALTSRSSLWVAMLPAIPFLMAGIYAVLFGQDSFITSADPSYNYLVNSYEVMTGAAPFAIHHPGTTLQYLMGVTNWISWLVSGGQDSSFAASIVSRPEWYLDVDLIALILMQTAALIALSVTITRRWGVTAALAFSGGVFVLIGPEFNLFLVGPVALGFALALFAMALAIKIISGNASKYISTLFGVVLVCGVMNKATFLPMFALLGIYFFAKGFRAALIGLIVSLLVFALLIRDQIFHLGYWFVGLLSTTGRNPADVSNVPLLEKIFSSPRVLVSGMPWILLLFAIYLIALIILVIHSRKSNLRVISNPVFVISILVVVMIVGSTLMTIKDYRQGDLIVVAAVAPILLASSFVIFAQVYPRIVLGRTLLAIAILIAIVGALQFFNKQIAFAQQEASSEYLAEIEYLEARRSQGDYVAMAYGVFTPATALGFGDDLSNHLLTNEIATEYPRQFALNLETLGIQTRTPEGLVDVECETLKKIEETGSSIIVGPGRGVDIDRLSAANGATVTDLVASFGQWPVYSLSDFSCWAD